ncbi:hypothetical protein NKZ03_17630 [Sinorhizobium meliloti]|uniref:hypothetical protein n=1 Tax=Rhizobium meliloti TaxID=382 RepID=UPI003D651DE1
MSERTKKFSEELDRLISEGDALYMAIRFDHYGKEFEKQVEASLGNDKTKAKEYISRLPNFRKSYQKWYSKAQAVIKQVIPDRLSDFNSYFEYPRVRKEITSQNYMVRDYLQGLNITRNYGRDTVVDGSAAIPEFEQQLNIVKAAKETLDSTLMDLKGVLQADLFDSEIESAGALAKAGYLRASGAICGVVIEKHLSHVCETHGIAVRKKNPGISDLNQLLRDNGITTVPQWRFIQHLADIRNICDHAKGREPTKEEIDDLVAGSEKVLKTVF